jgi:hypothetical protein
MISYFLSKNKSKPNNESNKEKEIDLLNTELKLLKKKNIELYRYITMSDETSFKVEILLKKKREAAAYSAGAEGSMKLLVIISEIMKQENLVEIADIITDIAFNASNNCIYFAGEAKKAADEAHEYYTINLEIMESLKNKTPDKSEYDERRQKSQLRESNTVLIQANMIGVKSTNQQQENYEHVQEAKKSQSTALLMAREALKLYPVIFDKEGYEKIKTYYKYVLEEEAPPIFQEQGEPQQGEPQPGEPQQGYQEDMDGGKRISKGKSKKVAKKPVVSQNKQSIYKEILGKQMKIYKMPDSRKEYVKYKGKLHPISEYKSLMKQKALAKPKSKK